MSLERTIFANVYAITMVGNELNEIELDYLLKDIKDGSKTVTKLLKDKHLIISIFSGKVIATPKGCEHFDIHWEGAYKDEPLIFPIELYHAKD